MDRKGYAQSIGLACASLGKALDDIKASFFGRDRRRLARAKEDLDAGFEPGPPPAARGGVKREKAEALERLRAAAEELMQTMRTALSADIPFSDDAARELGEVMALVKDAVRDTGDALATENPRFRQYLIEETAHIDRRIEEFAAAHKERLTAATCAPRTSFLYVDIMRSLKRLALGLASVARNT